MSVYGTGKTKRVIDGAWTDWTSWSTCQENCRNSRNRTCDNPTPLFGGQECSSEYEEEETPGLCYGANCCPDSSDVIGCFVKEKFNNPIAYITYSQMSPCYCIGYCNSLNYSLAATYISTCTCGDEPGTMVNSTSCSRSCYGDASSKCGGTTRGYFVSVYGTERLYKIYLVNCDFQLHVGIKLR